MKKRLYFLLMLLMCIASVQLNAQTTLKGYWKMDDGTGTTVTDDLGLNNGTLVNASGNNWVDGYLGKALDFTTKASADTSVFVVIPGSDFDFKSAQSFSFSVIAKLPKTDSQEQSLISKGMPFVTTGGWYHFSYKGTAGRFMLWDTKKLPSPEGKFPSFMPDNDWVNIVCVKDAAKDSMFVYLNGVLLDKTLDITEGEISNDGDLFIGCVPNFKTTVKGAIDEVKIFEGALTPGDVEQIATDYGFQPLNVAGYWKMDDGAGTTVSDELGKNDGSLYNGSGNNWVDGYIGKALDFTTKASADTSVFVEIPGTDFDFKAAESFSFSIIAKLPKTDSQEQSLLSKGMPFVNTGGWYHLSYKGTAARFMIWDTKKLPSPDGKFPSYMPDNDWVNIVCVKDAVKDSMFVYLNGVLLDKALDITTLETANDGPLFIGCVPNFKTTVKGAIDEVKIFRTALSPGEVKKIAGDYGFQPLNLAGYWKMDDGAGTTVSDELGKNNGSLYNGSGSNWVDGYIGKALDFTTKASADTSVFVEIPGTDFDFKSAQSFSFSVIAKLPKTDSQEQSLISKGMPFVNTGGWYHLSYKGTAARFMLWDTKKLPSPDGKFPKFMPANDWVNLVCVKDVDKDSMFVYLNGELLDKALDITEGEISNDGPLYIGCVPNFKTTVKGAIDEVKIYKSALTPAEVKQIATDYGFNPLTSLVGYWSMDDGTGTTVSDVLGKNDGTLYNGSGNNWVDGYMGKALDFTTKTNPDTSVFVRIPGSSFDFKSNQSFAFSVIAKLPKTDSQEQSIISKGMPFVNTGGWWHLSYKGTAARFMIWDTKKLPSPDGKFPKFMPDNDWVHLVCVKDVAKDSMFVYLNGVLLDKALDITEGEISTDGDLFIGCVPNFKTTVKGAIDEVKIFQDILTPEEVKAMSEAYGFRPISSLVGYWKMDEGYGTAVKDDLGKNNGKLYNASGTNWVDGYIGKALDFTTKTNPDTSVFVTIPGTDFDFKSAQSFSFSVIAKLPKSDSQEQSIISKGMPFVNTGGWWHLSYKGTAARFMIWDTKKLPSPDGKFPKVMPDNDWVNITCVKDFAKDSMFVYLNGELLDKALDITEGEISNDGPLFIGCVPNFKTTVKGAIDEVKIFQDALTPAEVKKIATDYGFEPITNVAGYWKMDDGTGTTVTDELGKSDGTLFNGSGSNWVDGYIGKALDFTTKASADTSVFVEIPGTQFDFKSAESFSFSVIAKLPKSVAQEQSIISKGMPFVNTGGWWHLSYKGTAARFMIWDTKKLPSPEGKFPGAFPELDWVNLVCVKDFDKDSMFVYLNGVLLDKALDITEGEISTDGPLFIGCVPNFKTTAQGAIDEVKIFKGALTPEEVLKIATDYGFSPIATAVAEINIDESGVYPNPVSNTLYIKNAENAVLSIYNMNGALIRSSYSSSKNAEMDVTSLRSGMYLMKIQSANNVSVIKFMKQ
jgi:uncharacterized protein YnzC (UPF0291/DUF896 family)